MNLILIGFRCAGKSSVGTYIAKRTRKEFIDCDDYIENRTHLAIREIFDIAGETHFRTLESDAIADLSKGDDRIIATGGGAVLRYKNITNLKRNGVVVFLDVEPESAWDRLRNDPKTERRRPPLTDQDPFLEIREQVEFRKPYYRSASDLTVKTDGKSVDEIVREILDYMKPYGYEEVDDGDAQPV